MVLLVCPLVFITALLQRETLRNKTKIKPTPKPTLTTKQIKNTKWSHASNVAIEESSILHDIENWKLE